MQLPSGGEARFRVVGTVRALDDNGRVAYVRPARVLAADPGAAPAGRGQARARAPTAPRSRGGCATLGAQPAAVGGATTRNGAFLGTLAALLRVVAIIDALVCLYALVQALGLVARERAPDARAAARHGRRGRRPSAPCWPGAALAVALPAAVLALALERLVLAPLVGRLAAGYADLGAAVLGRPGGAGPRRAGAARRRGRRVGRAPGDGRAARCRG